MTFAYICGDIPFWHLVADGESDASTDTCISLQKRQNLTILAFYVLLQLLLSYGKIVKDLLDNDLSTSLCSDGACALEFARDLEFQTCTSGPIHLTSCDDIELR